METKPTDIKFRVTFAEKESCGARRGKLELRRNGALCILETPALVLDTSFGCVPFLTPDFLSDLRSLGLSAVHLLAHDSALRGLRIRKNSCEYLNDTLQYPDWVISIISPCPLSNEVVQIGTSSFVACDTVTGRQKFMPEQYINSAILLKPDILIGLHYDCTEREGSKYHIKAHQRSIKWLDTCLKSSKSIRPCIFGAAHGGDNLRRREMFSAELAQRDISGVVITGLRVCKNSNSMQSEILASLTHIPVSLPRSVQQLGSPIQILTAVLAGIDMFHSDWPIELTKKGRAFVAKLVMDDESLALLCESLDINDKSLPRDESLDNTGKSVVIGELLVSDKSFTQHGKLNNMKQQRANYSSSKGDKSMLLVESREPLVIEESFVSSEECNVSKQQRIKDLLDSNSLVDSVESSLTEKLLILSDELMNHNAKNDSKQQSQSDLIDNKLLVDSTESVTPDLPYEFDCEMGTIDLSNEVFKRDKQPIVVGCTCVACLHHSRAYIRHLLVVNELAGEILLMVHNCHRYLLFFHEIRRNIENQNIDKYLDWWKSGAPAN